MRCPSREGKCPEHTSPWSHGPPWADAMTCRAAEHARGSVGLATPPPPHPPLKGSPPQRSFPERRAQAVSGQSWDRWSPTRLCPAASICKL